MSDEEEVQLPRRPAPQTYGSASFAPIENARRAEVARSLKRVDEALRAEPYTFGFFQAVRLLERLHPHRQRPGEMGEPAKESVRFGVNPSIAFPPSEIHELTFTEQQATMRVNFMGLTGPQGVLPHDYSMLVQERLRVRDTALPDFLDLFNHRILTLFYEAWRSYRSTIAAEDGTRDRLENYLRDLIGLGMETCRERLPFPDEALIYRAGLLAGQPRGAVALEQLLEDFFGLPVDVHQFVGGWFALDESDRCQIGDDEHEGNLLGQGAVAGDEIWDQQSRVRVRLGPLNREQYDSFLPGGTGHTAMSALLRFFSHNQFDFELQLVLAREEVTGLVLGDADASRRRLGWSTWICSAERTRDADETVLSFHAGAA